MSKKVLLILADGFEEIEAITPIDILRRAGMSITLCGLDKKEVTGGQGVKIIADITIDRIVDDYDALILPGGGLGAKNLSSSNKVIDLIKKMHGQGRIIAAICASPAIVLGPTGVLSGKKATCYPGMEDAFPKTVTALNQSVVVDGNIISANGPGAASSFSFKLVELLSSIDAVNELKKGMCYR